VLLITVDMEDPVLPEVDMEDPTLPEVDMEDPTLPDVDIEDPELPDVDTEDPTLLVDDEDPAVPEALLPGLLPTTVFSMHICSVEAIGVLVCLLMPPVSSLKGPPPTGNRK
jgi:hypothetical protein